jgi:hypothetical protein
MVPGVSSMVKAYLRLPMCYLCLQGLPFVAPNSTNEGLFTNIGVVRARDSRQSCIDQWQGEAHGVGKVWPGILFIRHLCDEL